MTDKPTCTYTGCEKLIYGPPENRFCLHHLRELHQMQIAVIPPAAPPAGGAEAVSGVGAAPAPAIPPTPASPKSAWVSYVVDRHGVDADEAAAMTKHALIQHAAALDIIDPPPAGEDGDLES